MILTVTLNPSVDISYKLEEFLIDDVNRCKDVVKTAGGKGLNVARVLKQLGEEVNTTGFLGGYTGEFIETELKKLNIFTNFYEISGNTRNCIAVLHGGKQTEILEVGDIVKQKEQTEFLELFNSLLKENLVVTISGSMPQGIEKDYYEKLLQIANDKDIKVILDTSGDSLKNIVLNSNVKPYCIKPNETEINQVENKDFEDREELIEYLRSDIFKGIELMVITMGSRGALVKFKDDFYSVNIPKIKVVNPVGSGDSTVAGIAYGINKKLNIEETIKYGMACGILNTMEEKTGYIDVSKIKDIKDKVEVVKL
ncbi:hexose kinase [Miniphocaeibacter massiliensis]|uniref:hexose kinase n=1 Tax=Miniphocaeibacter massiliensis TaxID=2041841 RepID=UPI000C1C6BFA|nr:hexose kinase [Miniphocaeibacter massiliensis]